MRFHIQGSRHIAVALKRFRSLLEWLVASVGQRRWAS